MAYDFTNVRLGFATNSSSSHSIILNEGTFSSSPVEGTPQTFGFGWDDFHLHDSAHRVAYLYAGVSHTLHDLPGYQRRGILNELFKDIWPSCDIDGQEDAYIDHQSAFTLPDPSSESFPFIVKEALEFFCDDRVEIFGGNDNDGAARGGPIHIGDEHNTIRVRRDGDNYVLFNWASGTKVRIAPEGSVYKKSSKPELIDVKITNACNYGCQFCYQGSTKTGKDADRYRLMQIIEAIGIKGLGVFEVAIGGGEPTASENFVSVINDCISNYIKPNFTTFAVDWLLDKEKVKAAQRCGGIGVSVHDIKGIDKIEKIQDVVGTSNVIGQHVYGTLPVKETIELIQAFSRKKLPLLLLGYKDVGFGASTKPHDMSKMTSTTGYPSLSYHNIPDRLSVDTAFVQNHPEFVMFVRANSKSISAKEGAFSMYIDAVESKIGPSSYCDPSEMTVLPDPRNADVTKLILDHFRSYEGEM